MKGGESKGANTNVKIMSLELWTFTLLHYPFLSLSCSENFEKLPFILNISELI